MIPHGTVRGYRQHQNRGHRGIDICDDCRAEWNRYIREYKRANYDPAKRRAIYLAAKARGYYTKKGKS